MATTRKSLSQLAKLKPKIRRARVIATTDAGIARHAEEDDNRIWTARDLRNARVVHAPTHLDIRGIRRRLRMSQAAFARHYGFSTRTVQEWEQGRAQPDRPARILLAMIERAPKTVERILRRL